MTRVRRLAAGLAVAGTLFIPFAVSSAPPAVAYCEPTPAPAYSGPGSYSSTGCTNSCQDADNLLTKVIEGNGGDTVCPQ